MSSHVNARCDTFMVGLQLNFKGEWEWVKANFKIELSANVGIPFTSNKQKPNSILYVKTVYSTVVKS